MTKPVCQSTLHDCLATAVSRTNAGGELGVQPQVRAAASPRQHGKRILVAEDNAVNQQVARGLLEARGYRVDAARNGREAIEDARPSLPRQPMR